ncbi:class B sortase [Sellimonas catena]|uniref:SrtB family sortase n=1 Tax=Sellimonas catena TaxID=2994035 RepID=A0A9W6CGD2_9FIRM|nr:class B sortase [Sellimonas catena]GLG89488.1 SrtB family sortase [Sellimonas catena]
MRNKGRKLLILFFTLVILGCGGYLIWYYTGVYRNQDADEKAKEAKIVQEEEQTEKQEIDIPIDFESLQAENPDVYAWIQIPGTAIDYPIVQHETDELYYLEHAWDGSASSGGAIFTQAYNSKDFTDYNTVIYGHEMGNGTMFNDLHQYMDENFWTDHHTVVIYTPEKKLTYQIFAAVVYDDRHLMKSFQFLASEDRQVFLDSLDDIRDLRSHIDDSVPVTTDSKLITLSTCLGTESNYRYLVEAVLVDEEG